jgi:hypothetical protein
MSTLYKSSQHKAFIEINYLQKTAKYKERLIKERNIATTIPIIFEINQFLLISKNMLTIKAIVNTIIP